MRHRHDKTLEFKTGVQKRSLVIRSLLTNLVKYGAIKTTSKKAMIEVRKNAKRYKEEIKSVTESIKKDEWEDFLKELTC